MNSRVPAVAALVLGFVGATLSAVSWPVAIVAGIAAILLFVVTRLVGGGNDTDRGLAIGGLVLGVVAVGLAVFVPLADDDDSTDGDAGTVELSFVDGIGTATPDATNPPQRDIGRPLPCYIEIGVLRAGGKITNTTSAPADYVIIVRWEDQGSRLASNTAVVRNVVPGLTTTFEISAPGEGSLRTTCRVERVDRVPAGSAGATR